MQGYLKLLDLFIFLKYGAILKKDLYEITQGYQLSTRYNINVYRDCMILYMRLYNFLSFRNNENNIL